MALIGQTLLTEIGGSMGPLYGTFFLQMSSRAKDEPGINEKVFGEMLGAARSNLEELGGAKVGDKTIMDVLIPAANAYAVISPPTGSPGRSLAVTKGASFEEALEAMATAEALIDAVLSESTKD